MALSAHGLLVSRNLAACVGKSRLIVDFHCDDLLQLANDGFPLDGAVLAYHHHGARRDAEARAGRCAVHFGTLDLPASAGFDLVLLSLPQGRETREMIFAWLAGQMSPEGRMLVVGETRAGIRPARDALARRFSTVETLDSARRCALISASGPVAGQAAVDPIANWASQYDAVVGAHTVPVCSLPGVFSHGRLDEGTRVLLESLDSLEFASPPRVLDMGCGCGVIGAFVHALQPGAQVSMVDDSALAVAAAQRTCRLNGMDPGCVWPSDVYSEVSGSFELILSNPPFHSGVATDWSISERFLGGVVRHLAPGGAARLVAHWQLPYERLLRAQRVQWHLAQEADDYCVYEIVA